MLERTDLLVTDALNIIDILIFVLEEADPAKRAALDGAVVGLLYLAGEQLRQASVNHAGRR